MRSHIRYLPAALPLLLPLAVLAFLGSSEFSRLQQRAEVSLRERAFDLLELAATRFDKQLDEMTEQFVEPALSTDFPDVKAATRALRERHPYINEIVILRSSGSLVHPRRRQMNAYPWLRERRALMARMERDPGDLDEQERQTESRTMGPDRSGVRARFERLLLAEVCQQRGQRERARKHYAAVLENIIEFPEEPERRSRRPPRIDTTSIYDLGCRVGLIETDEDPPRSEHIGPVVQRLCAGEYSEVPADILMDALRRLQEHAMVEHGEAFQLAAASSEEQVRHHQFSRDYEDLARAPVQKRLQQVEGDELVFHPYDTEIGAQLLVLRRVKEEESELYQGTWVGTQLQLEPMARKALDGLLTTRDDGFYVDMLSPQGNYVLGDVISEDLQDLEGEILSRPSIAGLQFHAIPRNARVQLDERRAFGRNRSLLILALCLTAVGGAFFLLRTVNRESELAGMKVDLVSRVSHELKTPLAMIKMYGDTLGMGRTRNSDQAKQFANIISREADRLTIWIDRILDFSRHEEGKITYHVEHVDLTVLLHNVTEAYRPHVEAANISLTTELEEDVEVEVDPGMMESTVVNLLENAVKYTPGSSPERTIHLELSTEKNSAVLRVMDRGVGIPQGEEQKIFDSFYRAGSAGEVRGAGLGLSLVRHFAKHHRGTVEAQARDGGGTIFELRLPLPSNGER